MQPLLLNRAATSDFPDTCKYSAATGRILAIPLPRGLFNAPCLNGDRRQLLTGLLLLQKLVVRGIKRDRKEKHRGMIEYAQVIPDLVDYGEVLDAFPFYFLLLAPGRKYSSKPEGRKQAARHKEVYKSVAVLCAHGYMPGASSTYPLCTWPKFTMYDDPYGVMECARSLGYKLTDKQLQAYHDGSWRADMASAVVKVTKKMCEARIRAVVKADKKKGKKG